MPFFSDQQVQQSNRKRKFWQNIIMVIGAGSFLGGSGVPIVTGIIQSFTQPTQTEVAQAKQEDATAKLRQQETGFLEVLKREPNNPNALQGLANIRLQLGDPAGAKEPATQLVTMYPKQKEFRDLLTQIDGQLTQKNQQPSESTTPSPTKNTTP